MGIEKVPVTITCDTASARLSTTIIVLIVIPAQAPAPVTALHAMHTFMFAHCHAQVDCLADSQFCVLLVRRWKL